MLNICKNSGLDLEYVVSRQHACYRFVGSLHQALGSLRRWSRASKIQVRQELLLLFTIFKLKLAASSSHAIRKHSSILEPSISIFIDLQKSSRVRISIFYQVQLSCVVYGLRAGKHHRRLLRQDHLPFWPKVGPHAEEEALPWATGVESGRRRSTHHFRKWRQDHQRLRSSSRQSSQNNYGELKFTSIKFHRAHGQCTSNQAQWRNVDVFVVRILSAVDVVRSEPVVGWWQNGKSAFGWCN